MEIFRYGYVAHPVREFTWPIHLTFFSATLADQTARHAHASERRLEAYELVGSTVQQNYIKHSKLCNSCSPRILYETTMGNIIIVTLMQCSVHALRIYKIHLLCSYFKQSTTMSTKFSDRGRILHSVPIFNVVICASKVSKHNGSPSTGRNEVLRSIWYKI
jgi:hypothetical protein